MVITEKRPLYGQSFKNKKEHVHTFIGNIHNINSKHEKINKMDEFELLLTSQHLIIFTFSIAKAV